MKPSMARSGALTSLALSGVALVALAAAPAAAQVDPLATAAQHLSPGSPVYVDPSATQLLGPAQTSQLATEIESGRAPIFVAVVPASALQAVGNNPGALPTQLGRDLGRPGSIAVVTPQGLEADNDAASGLTPGLAGQLATQAYQRDHGQGVFTTLSDWVRSVQAAYHTPRATPYRAAGHRASGAPLVLLAVVVGGVLLVVRSLRRRRMMGGGGFGAPRPGPVGMPPPNGQGYVGNYGGGGPGYWYGGGYNGGQYYQPGYYNQRSPFGAALLGGAVGGLIGEELGRHMGGEGYRDDGYGSGGGYAPQDPGQDWSNAPTDQSGGGGDWTGDSGWGGGDSSGGGFDNSGGGW